MPRFSFSFLFFFFFLVTFTSQNTILSKGALCNRARKPPTMAASVLTSSHVTALDVMLALRAPATAPPPTPPSPPPLRTGLCGVDCVSWKGGIAAGGLPAGGALELRGPSGSGKSTLALHCVVRVLISSLGDPPSLDAMRNSNVAASAAHVVVPAAFEQEELSSAGVARLPPTLSWPDVCPQCLAPGSELHSVLVADERACAARACAAPACSADATCTHARLRARLAVVPPLALAPSPNITCPRWLRAALGNEDLDAWLETPDTPSAAAPAPALHATSAALQASPVVVLYLDFDCRLSVETVRKELRRRLNSAWGAAAPDAEAACLARLRVLQPPSLDDAVAAVRAATATATAEAAAVAASGAGGAALRLVVVDGARAMAFEEAISEDGSGAGAGAGAAADAAAAAGAQPRVPRSFSSMAGSTAARLSRLLGPSGAAQALLAAAPAAALLVCARGTPVDAWVEPGFASVGREGAADAGRGRPPPPPPEPLLRWALAAGANIDVGGCGRVADDDSRNDSVGDGGGNSAPDVASLALAAGAGEAPPPPSLRAPLIARLQPVGALVMHRRDSAPSVLRRSFARHWPCRCAAMSASAASTCACPAAVRLVVAEVSGAATLGRATEILAFV